MWTDRGLPREHWLPPDVTCQRYLPTRVSVSLMERCRQHSTTPLLNVSPRDIDWFRVVSELTTVCRPPRTSTSCHTLCAFTTFFSPLYAYFLLYNTTACTDRHGVIFKRTYGVLSDDSALRDVNWLPTLTLPGVLL